MRDLDADLGQLGRVRGQGAAVVNDPLKGLTCCPYGLAWTSMGAQTTRGASNRFLRRRGRLLAGRLAHPATPPAHHGRPRHRPDRRPSAPGHWPRSTCNGRRRHLLARRQAPGRAVPLTRPKLTSSDRLYISPASAGWLPYGQVSPILRCRALNSRGSSSGRDVWLVRRVFVPRRRFRLSGCSARQLLTGPAPCGIEMPYDRAAAVPWSP